MRKIGLALLMLSGCAPKSTGETVGGAERAKENSHSFGEKDKGIATAKVAEENVPAHVTDEQDTSASPDAGPAAAVAESAAPVAAAAPEETPDSNQWWCVANDKQRHCYPQKRGCDGAIDYINRQAKTTTPASCAAQPLAACYDSYSTLTEDTQQYCVASIKRCRSHQKEAGTSLRGPTKCKRIKVSAASTYKVN